jgi:hypothetical protein
LKIPKGQSESVFWPLWNICVINDHGYVPLLVNTSRSFPHSWLIIGFVTRLTRRVPLVEQELPTPPEHLSLPPFLWGSCYSFFSFMCMVCRSLFVFLYLFFLPLWMYTAYTFLNPPFFLLKWLHQASREWTVMYMWAGGIDLCYLTYKYYSQFLLCWRWREQLVLLIDRYLSYLELQMNQIVLLRVIKENNFLWYEMTRLDFIL